MRCRRSFAAFAVAVLLINYSGCGDNKETASNSSGGSTQVPAVATPVKKTEGTSPTSDKGGIDVSIITPDAFAAIVIHPRRIVQSPLVAEQLKNAEMGEMVKRLGVEPGDLEEVVVQFSMFESVPGHPEPVPTAIAHFTRDVDAKEVLAKLQEAESPNRKHEIKEVNVGGKTCLDPGGMVLAYAADKRTILVAPRPTMQKVLSAAESKGPLMERMKKADAAGDVIIALETGDWPDFEKIVDDAKRSAPFDVDAVKAVRGGTLTLNLAGGSILHAALDAKTAEGAEKIEGLLHDALKMARGELAALKQSAPKQLQAGFAPLFKLGEEFLDGAKTTKSDNQVVLDVKRPETLDTAAASIAGAVRQQLLEARFAGLRAQRMNNLRQIALAAQYYEAGSMRAPRVIEANGKPVLSWRVAILPYLDEAALYKEFHLTEPWDSPHNLEVAKKIPLVYQSPDGPQDGRTRIMVFTGKGTVFESGKEVRVPPPELSMMSPEAGSNTIICVEAGADKAVVWTSRSILRTRWPRWGRLRPTAFSPRFSTGACINSRLTTKRSMP